MRQARKSSVVALVGLLLLLLSPATASAARLTIRSDQAGVTFGGSVQISGALSGTGNVGGQEVELVELPYPYKRERHAGVATTNAAGNYQFRIRPEYNTRYFVRDVVTGLTSKRLFIWVKPFSTFDLTRPRVEEAILEVLFRWGPTFTGRRLNHRPVYLYLAGAGDKYARRVPKTGRTQLVGSGQLVVYERVLLRGIPKGGRYGIYLCLPLPNRDLGVFKPARSNCPKRRKYLPPVVRP